MSSSPLRKGREYDAARYKFMGVCEQADALCWLCGKPIDYKAKANTAKAFELDHAQPISTHPELAYEPSNFRASHSLCNRQRGAKHIPTSTRPTSWTPANW